MTNNYNLFDDYIEFIPNFNGTYGDAIVQYLSKDIIIKEHNWNRILRTVKQYPEAFNQLMTFCLTPVLCNNKGGLISDNKLIYKEYFQESNNHHIIGLLRNTSIDIKDLNGGSTQYLSYSSVPDNLASLDRTPHFGLNFNALKANAINLLIENFNDAQETFDIISSCDLYYSYFDFPSYESWTIVRNIHEKFHPEQYIDQNSLYSLIFEEIENKIIDTLNKNKFADYDYSTAKEHIINIFNIYKESQDKKFFNIANAILQKYEKNIGFRIISIFNQLEDILDKNELNNINNYHKYTARSSDIFIKPIENMYQINAVEIISRLKASKAPKTSFPLNAVDLSNKIIKAIDILTSTEQGKNNPFLSSISLFSSPSHVDKFFISLEPIHNISVEKQEQFLNTFLTTFLDNYLFMKDKDGFREKSIIFLENELLNLLIPENNITTKSKSIKF